MEACQLGLLPTRLLSQLGLGSTWPGQLGLFIFLMVNQDITNVPNKKFGGYDLEYRKKTLIFKKGPYNYQNALYTRKHFYLPKGLRKHMQGGVCMPC